MVVGLPEKAIQKVDKELLELHREVLKSYLTQRSLKHKYQKKFFKIYDYYISEKNIRRFFFRPAKLFVYALVTDRLDDIEDYVPLKISTMFPERVKSVTLDKSKITYYLQSQGRVQSHDEYPINPELYQVEDLAFDCGMRSNQYIPDYAIKGYFKVDENMLHPVFIENIDGPHLLYISGMPRNISVQEKNKFRFPDPVWLSYWEDKYIGYLFQVVTRESALNHLINQ